MKTLRVRVERQTETARDLAARLEAHPAVETVRYPGFGGLMSFDVAGGEAARLVETSTQLIENATSLGGVESSMEARHRWEGARCPRRTCACRSASRTRTTCGPTSSRRSPGA